MHMKGRPNKANKNNKKKQTHKMDNEPNYIETAPVQLSCSSAVALMKEMVLDSDLFTPTEDNEQEAANTLSQLKTMAASGIKLMETGAKILDQQDAGIVNQTNQVSQLTSHLQSALIGAARIFVGNDALVAKEQELNQPGNDAIEFITRITKLPSSDLIKYVKVGFKEEYALEVPSNYLGTEVLKLYMQKLGYNLLFAAPKNGDEERTGHFIVSMALVEKLKDARRDWIIYFGQFTPLSILLTQYKDIVTPVYKDGYLIVLNKNLKKQTHRNHVHSLIEMPITEMPNSVSKMEKLLQLVAMIDKYEQVARIVIVKGMVAIVPYRTHDKLDWLNLRCVPLEGFNRYFLEYKDIDLLSDHAIQLLDQYLQNQLQKLSLINLFEYKYQNIFSRINGRFLFENEVIKIELSSREFAIMQPLVAPLNIKAVLHENNKVIATVSIEDFSQCTQKDLSNQVKEIENNIAVAVKYVQLKRHYGTRFLPEVSFVDALALGEDVLQQKENEIKQADKLIEDEKQARKEEERLALLKKREEEKNRSKKKALLDNLINSDIFVYQSWSHDGDRLYITRITQKERCFLNCLQIPGLVINEQTPHIILDLAKIDEMSLNDLQLLVDKAQLFAKKMKIIDQMVCLVRGEKGNRFTDAGLKFTFRDNEYQTEFMQAWKPIGKLTLVEGVYYLSLACCGDEAITVDILQEKLAVLSMHFSPKAKSEEPKQEENDKQKARMPKLKEKRVNYRQVSSVRPQSAPESITNSKVKNEKPHSKIPPQPNADSKALLPPVRVPAGKYNWVQASASQMELVPPIKSKAIPATKPLLNASVTYTATVFVPKISCEPIDKLFIQLVDCVARSDMFGIRDRFIQLADLSKLANQLVHLGKINIELKSFIDECRNMKKLTQFQANAEPEATILVSEAERGIKHWLKNYVPVEPLLRVNGP